MHTFPTCHFAPAPLVPATVEYTDVITNGVTQTSISDTIAIGTAPAAGETRHVIAFLFGDVSVHRSVTSCTIGGVTATKIIEDASSDRGMGSVWIAEVPTGTTASLVANFDAFLSYSGGVAFVARNLQSATPIDSHFTSSTGTTQTQTGVDEPVDGFVVAAAGEWTNVSGSYSWSGTVGVSEDADANVSGTNDLRVSGAHKNTTVNATNNSVIATCSVSPASTAYNRLFVLEMR